MKKKILIPLLIILFVICVNISNGQWIQITNGLPGTGVSSLGSKGNNIYAGTLSNGIYLSSNNGLNWQQCLNLSINTNTNSIVSDSNFIFAGVGTSLGGLYRSQNDGASWISVLPNLNITSIAISGNKVYAGHERMASPTGVYFSSNNGTSWVQTSLNNKSIGAILIKGNTVFAGARGTGGGVYYTNDSGNTWNSTSLVNKNICCLAVVGSNLFAGTAASGDGVYISTDNGLTWTHTALYYETFSLISYGNCIFAGTSANGVYMSTDNGAGWIQKNQGFTEFSFVYTMLIKNNYIFAGTAYNSIWRRSVSEITGINNLSSEIPEKFSLSQNYPNPFNPTTKIRYQITRQGGSSTNNKLVTLKVYDILGKEVEILVNEKQAPGTYEVSWNARHGGSSSYPSGVYYYQLSVDNVQLAIKKMVLIK